MERQDWSPSVLCVFPLLGQVMSEQLADYGT